MSRFCLQFFSLKNNRLSNWNPFFRMPPHASLYSIPISEKIFYRTRGAAPVFAKEKKSERGNHYSSQFESHPAILWILNTLFEIPLIKIIITYEKH